MEKKKIKILVAEDNKLNLNFIIETLDKLNILYETAVNGEKAVELVSQKDYDLILMDCQMPVMDGYRATSIIRNFSSDKNKVPIIALTAGSSDEDKNRCVSAGMNDYLSKPLNLQEFTEKIENLLYGNRKYLKVEKNRLNSSNVYENSINLLLDELLLSRENAEKFLDDYIFMALKFVREMEQAYKNLDYEEIKTLAHQIKGVSSNLRLKKMQDIFTEIEFMAKENENDIYIKFGILRSLLDNLIHLRNTSKNVLNEK